MIGESSRIRKFKFLILLFDFHLVEVVENSNGLHGRCVAIWSYQALLNGKLEVSPSEVGLSLDLLLVGGFKVRKMS